MAVAGQPGPAKGLAVRVARWQLWSLPAPLRALLIGGDALAAGLTALALLSMPWRLGQLLTFAGLLACGIAAIEATRGVREAHTAIHRDLQTVWYLAIAITLPPGYAMLAPVPMAAYRIWRVSNGVLYKRVFSNATLALAYGAVSLIFRMIPRSLGGRMPWSHSHVLLWTLAVTGCAVTGWVINHSLLLIAVRLSDPAARLRDLYGPRATTAADLLEISLSVTVTFVVAASPALMALALPSVVLCRHYLMRSQQVAQVRIDAGTGLLNSRSWHREAEHEFFRALRAGTPLAVAMVGIDNFRAAQDEAGPEVTAQLRRDVASMLAEQLRDQDLIGTLGQDFAVLLPGAGTAEARQVSERMRDRISGESFAVGSGAQAGFVFRLTVSVGIAGTTGTQRSLADLIGAARSALGQAQDAGWNKVTAAEPARTAGG